MSEKREDGGPAFPYPDSIASVPIDAQDVRWRPGNLTVRDYACIELKVPDTGKPWLDKIIRVGARRELVGQTLAAVITFWERWKGEYPDHPAREVTKEHWHRRAAVSARHYVDAMEKASETTEEK